MRVHGIGRQLVTGARATPTERQKTTLILTFSLREKELSPRADLKCQRGRRTTNERVRWRQTDSTWVPFGSRDATAFL